jgi:dethiobiotin synthetase
MSDTMTRVVVLGTGTGIGKTTACAALAQALVDLGAPAVAALKPIETGYVEEGSDAERLASVSYGITPPERHPLYCFSRPVSPHLAARDQGVAIRVETVLEWVAHEEAACAALRRGFVIIETAGGALSPLSEQATNLDLARALEPACLLLVAPDALGVLHDVRATLTAMRALHRSPDHLVLSRARPADASTGNNADELPRLGLMAPSAVLAADPRREIASLAASILTG